MSQEGNYKSVTVLLAAVFEHDRRVKRTVETLASSGYRINVVALASAGSHDGFRGTWTTSSGAVVEQVHVRKVARDASGFSRFVSLLSAYGAAYVRMVRKAISLRSDIIHANDAETLPLALTLKMLRRGDKVIYDAHEYSPGLRSKGSLLASLSPVWKRIVLVSRRWVDHLITVSPELQRRYWDLGYYQSTLVRNVPELPAVAPFSVSMPTRFTKEEPLRCIYLGSMFPGRGIETGLAAFEVLTALDAPIQLTLVGEPRPIEYRTRIAETVERLGSHVSLQPRVPASEVQHVYAKHHVGLILLDVAEANRVYLPNKLFEIIIGGLGVVGPALPDIEYLLQTTGAGRVYDGSAGSLVAILKDLALDTSLVKDLRSRAEVAAANSLNWTVESSNLISAYRSVG